MSSKKTIGNALLPLVCAMLASPLASAGNVDCAGQVTQINIGVGGAVTVNGDWSRWITLCDTDDTWNGISDTNCRSWLSLAQSAYYSGKPFLVRFNNRSETSCAELGEWGGAGAPFVIRLEP